MNRKEKLLRPQSKVGSGRVKQYFFSKGRKITQISTFCPDIIGPGPTHVYVIEDEALTLVDTGIPTYLAKKMFYGWRRLEMPQSEKELSHNHSEMELSTGLKAAGYSMEDIELMIITHGHPDHYLLGRAIVEKSKTKVVSHVLDTDQLYNPWGFVKRMVEGQIKFPAMGMPYPKSSAQAFPREIEREYSNLSLQVDYPIVSDGLLSFDGFHSKMITVKHSPGHSPGSICLIIGSEEDKEKMLICGDVLLYPITPHPDDLITYLRTLDDLKQLQNIALVLPAHGKNMRNPYGRIDFLKKHHRRRLEFTYKACKTPKSPWEIATTPHYFSVFIDPGKFNPMAGNEAFIHMRLLEMVGGICRSDIKDSKHYFKNTGERFGDVYKRVLELIHDRQSTVL